MGARQRPEDLIAIELAGVLLPDPAKEPYCAAHLRKLLEDRHERTLTAAGLAKEAQEIRACKQAAARAWLDVLQHRKREIQEARCAQSEPYPDLMRWEIEWRARMRLLRVYLWLHFAGVRGLERGCQRLMNALIAAARPPAPVVPLR